MTEETTTLEPTIAVAPKKKRVNSKKKGSGFEGHIGKILGDNLTPMKFRRSQSSGAILGGVNERFMEHYSDDAKAMFIGDVVPTNEADVFRDLKWKLKFTLECKFYKSPDSIDHLFNNTKIKGWFEQAATDAAKIGKEPLLIFKFNHCDTFCGVDANTIDRLPKTVKRQMNIKFEDGRHIAFFKLDEAILDIDWWKNYSVPEAVTKWSEP